MAIPFVISAFYEAQKSTRRNHFHAQNVEFTQNSDKPPVYIRCMEHGVCLRIVNCESSVISVFLCFISFLEVRNKNDVLGEATTKNEQDLRQRTFEGDCGGNGAIEIDR